ncbi:hypothetical protein BH11BAC4_BH11BAC4_24380 [soil metagenome]
MPNAIYLHKKIQYPVLSFFEKSYTFIKQSLLISIIFASILYMLMRLFFIGADFSTAESIELYVKTLLITCSYINAWRVICRGIIWIEGKTSKVNFKGIFSMQVMKRAAILIVVAGLAYKVKANPVSTNDKCCVSATAQPASDDVIPQFYLWTK